MERERGRAHGPYVHAHVVGRERESGEVGAREGGREGGRGRRGGGGREH